MENTACQLQLSFTMNLGACSALNTAWKLQYTPLHSLEVGKKKSSSDCPVCWNWSHPLGSWDVHKSLLCQRSKYCFSVVLAEWEQLLWQCYMCPPLPQGKWVTHCPQRRKICKTESHTVTKAHMHSFYHQINSWLHEITFSIYHFNRGWLINRNKQYLGNARKLNWRHSPEVTTRSLEQAKHLMN